MASNKQKESLADWLAKRLNKCLPMDNWQRNDLELLLKSLRGEK